MNKLISVVVTSTILFSAQTVFACDYPTRVSLANGTTATKEEMVQSQRDVKTFITEMEAYLECIVEDEKTARASMPDIQSDDELQREEMLNKNYNAGVVQLEKVAAEFNSEVQAYKAKEDS
jgi:hypothetical protein